MTQKYVRFVTPKEANIDKTQDVAELVALDAKGKPVTSAVPPLFRWRRMCPRPQAMRRPSRNSMLLSILWWPLA